MCGGSLPRAPKSVESQGSSQPRRWCQGDLCVPMKYLHRMSSLQCLLVACFWVLVVPFTKADHLVWDTFAVISCLYLRVNEFVVFERKKMFSDPFTCIGGLWGWVWGCRAITTLHLEAGPSAWQQASHSCPSYQASSHASLST